MGEVRAARDLRLERDVAVKLLHPDLAAQPTVRERFEAEARAAARLVHPHVVSVFDSGEDAGVPFLVMERLSGRTVGDAISEGPMDPGDVRELGIQVLEALAAAHAAGLIHRDIKPANILAAGPGRWKVGDFGIAKSVQDVDRSLTSTGLIIGTPLYLPPERLAGAAATPGGDLYALGVVLHEALIGRRIPTPTTGLADLGSLEPLDAVRPALPADLVAVVQAATAAVPADRFGSALEMAAVLHNHAVPVATAPTVAFSGPGIDPTRTLDLPSGALPTATRMVPMRRPSGRRRGVAVTAGAAVVIAVIVVAVSLGGGKASPKPGAPSTPTTPAASAPASAAGSAPPGAPAASLTSLPAPLTNALNNLEQAVKK